MTHPADQQNTEQTVQPPTPGREEAKPFMEGLQKFLTEKVAAFLGRDKKAVPVLLALGLTGIFLLAVSEWLPSGGQNGAKAQSNGETLQSGQISQTQSYCQQLETRLCALLNQVEGAGKVSVMVTMETGPQTVYVADESTDSTGKTSSEHVLVNGGEEPALITTVTEPQVQGVAVVCQGGANVAVQNRIIEMICTLTGIGASRVSVAEMAHEK